MSQIPDVIVIGGGINGVSTAYHLARHGQKVVLIEKRFIAGGPTGQSSAIVRQHYSNAITARMALESLQVWKNFHEVVGGDCGFTRVGFIVGVGPEDLQGLKANISLQQSVGIDTRFLSPSDIQAIEPHASLEGLGGAAFEPESGYCDAAMSANAFAQAFIREGGMVENGVRVNRLRVEGSRITGVESDQGFFPTGRVLLACGPWAPFLLQELGLELPMISARVKIGLYLRPPGFDHHRIWGDFANQIYLRPETGGLMLVGSIAPEEAEDTVENPDFFNERVDLETLADFGERAARRFPEMATSRLHSSYAALYDITPDWHPIMDAGPGIEGMYVMAGGSGHGFKLAPAAGKMMAKLILEGKRPTDDIALFAWDRFSSGRPVKGQYSYSIVG